MLLRLLQFYTPAFLKKKAIRILANETAGAFRCEAPTLAALSYEACLKQYALFTAEQAQKLITGNGDTETVKDSLFVSARRLGQELRLRLHIAKPEDVIMASRMIYQFLKIDMHADGQEGIRVDKCFFSRYYSDTVCRIISALDAGLAEGLSGGGKLEFYERITEGYPCCKAHFSLRELK